MAGLFYFSFDLDFLGYSATSELQSIAWQSLSKSSHLIRQNIYQNLPKLMLPNNAIYPFVTDEACNFTSLIPATLKLDGPGLQDFNGSVKGKLKV